MPVINKVVPHTAELDNVISFSDSSIHKIIANFNGSDVHLEWNENQAHFSFKSMGMEILGNVDITDENITVAIDVPLTAMIFKSDIEYSIDKHLREALEEHV